MKTVAKKILNILINKIQVYWKRNEKLIMTSFFSGVVLFILIHLVIFWLR